MRHDDDEDTYPEMRPPIDEENCVSVNDHIAPGTCHGCDHGRHYDGATDRAGCVCCRTVDEWVGRAAAESAAGPTELDRTEGDLAVAVREASTARAEVARLTAENGRLVRQQDATQVANIASRRSLCEQRDRLIAERDALSAVIADLTALAAEHWDWKAGQTLARRLRECLAGLAAPAVPQDCRSSAGITTGLVDAMISISRILAQRDLTEATDALADLEADKDFAVIVAAAGLAAPVGETPVEPPTIYERLVRTAEEYRALPDSAKPRVTHSCETPGEQR